MPMSQYFLALQAHSTCCNAQLCSIEWSVLRAGFWVASRAWDLTGLSSVSTGLAVELRTW